MTDQSMKDPLVLAVSKLVTSRDSQEGTIVSLPSIYTSGAPVQVRVSIDGDQFFVNDMGLARNEAELMGATARLFANQARDVANDYGILFDNHSFFAVHVSNEQLAAAIRVVGAASLKAVVATENKITEQNDSSERQEFVYQVEEAFGREKVSTDIEYSGSSTHSWRFAAKVDISTKTLLFDTVAQAPASIYSAHAKFSDIRYLERPPKGVIGIPSKNLLKPDYRNLLQQVANVVQMDAGVKVLKGLAA